MAYDVPTVKGRIYFMPRNIGGANGGGSDFVDADHIQTIQDRGVYCTVGVLDNYGKPHAEYRLYPYHTIWYIAFVDNPYNPTLDPKTKQPMPFNDPRTTDPDKVVK